jgi:3-hydroxyisobutyrate dehydrogenase-like beta-hydroxyacid dehydrogenase
MESQLVGFIGVGRMGGPMSSRLLDAGYSLCVFDTNPDVVKPLAARGVEVVGSPAEVASIAQIVLMSLPTPTIVQQVALGEQGVVQGSKVKTLVDLSTTGPGVASTVGQGVAERGITLVDSPVSGGVAGAKAGTLAVMVSCPKPTLAQVEPIL